MTKSGAKREDSRVANTHKSTGIEELIPLVLTSTGTGKARPYRPPVLTSTDFIMSNQVTFMKAPIYFQTSAAAQSAVPFSYYIKKDRGSSTASPPPYSSSPSPSHTIAIACNWDLLAIGDIVRTFGINPRNSIMFSFIDL
jgi:hypothetical protein